MILKIQAWSKNDTKITEADFILQLIQLQCIILIILKLQNDILCKKGMSKIKACFCNN